MRIVKYFLLFNEGVIEYCIGKEQLLENVKEKIIVNKRIFYELQN